MPCRPSRLPTSICRSDRHRLARPYRENPAWLAKVLAENLGPMQEQVGATYLPLITSALPLGEKVAVEFKEYGCGAYGCVLPTHDPQIVLKVTTDQSEKNFVERGMPWGWPAGISAYYGVMPMVGTYKLPKSIQREPAWLLWRESATEVGGIDRLEPIASIGETVEQFDLRESTFPLFDLLYDAGSRVHALFYAINDAGRLDEIWPRTVAIKGEAAATLRNTSMLDWGKIMKQATKRTTAVDLATHLEVFHHVVKAMERVAPTAAIGLTLSFYLERRLLLADLHTGNFGLCKREQPTWAITDPGHTVELPAPW